MLIIDMILTNEYCFNIFTQCFVQDYPKENLNNQWPFSVSVMGIGKPLSSFPFFAAPDNGLFSVVITDINANISDKWKIFL